MEGATTMANDELKWKLIEKMAEYYQDQDFEDIPEANVNGDRADPLAISMKACRKDGENATSFIIKIEYIFPMIDHDTMFELITDVKKRMVWDTRYVDLELLEHDVEAKSVIVFGRTPKPVIPLVT